MLPPRVHWIPRLNAVSVVFVQFLVAPSISSLVIPLIVDRTTEVRFHS